MLLNSKTSVSISSSVIVSLAAGVSSWVRVMGWAEPQADKSAASVHTMIHREWLMNEGIRRVLYLLMAVSVRHKRSEGEVCISTLMNGLSASADDYFEKVYGIFTIDSQKFMDNVRFERQKAVFTDVIDTGTVLIKCQVNCPKH